MKISKKEATMYICSIRYGLGRRTYITGLIADYLVTKEIPKESKKVMIRDIEECKDYGMDMDKREWMKLLKYLKKDL